MASPAKRKVSELMSFFLSKRDPNLSIYEKRTPFSKLWFDRVCSSLDPSPPTPTSRYKTNSLPQPVTVGVSYGIYEFWKEAPLVTWGPEWICDMLLSARYIQPYRNFQKDFILRKHSNIRSWFPVIETVLHSGSKSVFDT